VTKLSLSDNLILMAELDAALAATTPEPATSVSLVRSDRKCRRHEWLREDLSAVCLRCGVLQDLVRSRRGKSAHRLGGDQERRAEKRYGWRKIGEYGDVDDLRGRLMKVQQKSTRAAAPLRWKRIFAALAGTNDGRVPALLLSYVRQGVPVEDFIVVRGEDWLALHGKDE